VIKDFNFSSLHEQVKPLALKLKHYDGEIALRFKTDNVSGLVSQIENSWKVMAPGQPFHYSFMDDDFNHIYAAEQRIGKIFITFAILAIFIACLGLFGLVTYAAEQRVREIGVRKVLGATVADITAMLSKDLLRMVVVSLVIAFPLAWWAMHKWLEDFAYRTNISWWIFAGAGMIAICIALATISIQAVKAASANPVNSLRTE